MSWPTPQDYNEAIQNPKSCFSDPELQIGVPELDNLGLPRPISGAFASVYKIKCGTKEWAIRCFTNNVKDQKQRYDAISNHLKTVNLPYFVPFEYISQGIKVQGKWYPIVRMQWIKGDPLIRYIQQNLSKPLTLLDLTHKWIRMITAMQKSNIAHGDLQHGNIMIYNDDFMLIDYDGMYVPALHGLQSNELGHRNYQHPQRDNNNFGSNIDNFSAWVILVSLLAVSIDPTIWDVLDAGEDEERLLFSQVDFTSPETSHTFRILQLVADETFRFFVTYLKQSTQLELGAITVPDLSSISLRIEPTSKNASGIKTNTRNTHSPHPEWLAEMLGLNQDQESHTISNSNGAEWVLDHLHNEEIHMDFNSGVVLNRSVSFTLLMAGIFLTPFVFELPSIYATASTFSGLGSAFLFSGWQYRRHPIIKAKNRILKNKREFDTVLSGITNELTKLNKHKNELIKSEENNRTKLIEKQRKLSQVEKNETDRINRELQKDLNDLENQQRSLDQQEKNEIANSLTTYQTSWLQSRLKNHTIDDAKIPGIGSEMKRRLKSHAIYTAADIKDIKIYQTYGSYASEKASIVLSNSVHIYVEGIGPSKARALLEWKKSTELRYVNTLPSTIPQTEIQIIKSKYQTKRNSLNSQEQTVKNSTQQKKNAAMIKFAKENAILQKEIDATRLDLKNNQQKVEMEISNMTKELSAKQWEDAQIQRQLNTYKQINYLNFIRILFFFKK
ncbi:hypothetical protein SAMN04487897_109102 [Paenibacillus sp. yr247]|uniref:hypothetical protein n=1 Tax=Paenibacillus sp. yr247 TaxID=1761880 RepID=UPI00088A920E|nr:hypothetical protein [Paenibacillus sp. yr247]SDO17470.1 hypothetical protein SAMN04487897_109102 [Paenibacillus sp. yr247]